MYEYHIEVLKVIDGDTLIGVIDLGYHIKITQKIRLYGINAPETRTKNFAEKTKGIKSKVIVKQWVEDHKGTQLVIKSYLDDKYGRVLGEIYPEGSPENSVNQYLLQNNYAEPYQP